VLEPILQGWYPAQVFLDVLLADEPYWYHLAVRVGDGNAEDFFGPKDSFGVMPQGPVAQVGQASLGFIKPVVQLEVIFGLTAPVFHGA
jgi:hypothetical protein